MDIKILLVEDDKNIADIVKKFLVNEGYFVDICTNGDDALSLMYDKSYHLLILDIMLPGASGHELLKEYRKLSDSPVLMMTALDDDENEMRAFTNKADDYLIKPFSMPIMVKRVQALLWRSGFLKQEIKAGELCVVSELRKVMFGDKELSLTPKEYEILLMLVQSAGKIIPHETLLTRIWGYNFDGNEGIVHTTMKRLRDKMPVNIIKTIKGIGYSLED